MKKDGAVKVAGFKASAMAAGIKYKDRLDLGLILADRPCAAAGIYTTNRLKAPSVLLSRRRLRWGEAQAIIVNSGCANVCVGPSGMTNTAYITDAVANAAKINSGLCLMNSTGVIGEPLPAQRILKAVPELVAKAAPDGLDDFARAIMTTDTHPKTAARKIKIGDKTVTLSGVCKGSGMIMPDMATMLAYVLTDAQVPAETLREMLAAAAHGSFNAITVDGETSPSDSLVIMASGASEAKLDSQAGRQAFQEALNDVCLELAEQIVRDGEGATRLFRVVVEGARSLREGDLIARRIANSPLVKTAFHAADPNWGRIMSAIGSSKAKLAMERVTVSFESPEGKKVEVVKGGGASPDYDEAKAKAVLSGKEFIVRVGLTRGRHMRTILGCDLSAGYVKINANYRS